MLSWLASLLVLLIPGGQTKAASTAQHHPIGPGATHISHLDDGSGDSGGSTDGVTHP